MENSINLFFIFFDPVSKANDGMGTESDDRESESTSSCNECAGNVQSLQARDYEEIDGRAGLDDASAHARDTGTYGTLS